MSLIKEYKNLKIVIGDLIQLTKEGNFDVIAHGCNCFNTQGAGIALAFKNNFETDKYSMELTGEGSINKLGCIEGRSKFYQPQYDRWVDNSEGQYFEHKVTVFNTYTQFNYGGRSEILLDYDALRLVLRKINAVSKGLRVGLPLIGGGLAKGDQLTIQSIMDEELTDVDATLVIYG